MTDARSEGKRSIREERAHLDFAPSFMRHETFHPRYGWLKKGFDAVVKDPLVFTRDDASVILGVGKNMVRAIKYWCEAFGVIMPDPKDKKRTPRLVVTELGRRLLSNSGNDPYLEKFSSLWLLHWSLLQRPENATTWYFGFLLFPKSQFSLEEFTLDLLTFTAENLRARVAPGSIRRDAACFLRMYSSSEGTRELAEDSIGSPFVALRLLEYFPESRRYAFNSGSKISLPPVIVAYSTLRFLINRGQFNSSTVTLSGLLKDPNSPGRLFRLNETALAQALSAISGRRFGIELSDSSGLLQVIFKKPAIQIANALYEEIFNLEF